MENLAHTDLSGKGFSSETPLSGLFPRSLSAVSSRSVTSGKPNLPYRHSRSRLIPFTVRSLDARVVGQGDRSTFVKTDVEGHEVQVINGERELIRRFRPALLNELTSNPDDKDSPAAKICDWLTTEDYDIVSPVTARAPISGTSLPG